jgi:2-hydroxy-3-oxopropionate reductase
VSAVDAGPDGRIVGVVGLGVMGGAMASTLRRAGWTVVATSRSAEARSAVEATGARTVDTPASVASAADVIVLSLPGASAVREVLAGPAGLAAGARNGLTVVDASTLAPEDARSIAGSMAAAGIAYLDAPVSGGAPAAQDGTLSVMVGGDAAALERARPILETLASRIVHCGAVGAGSVAKACNQLIVLATIGAVAESLAIADGAGVDPATVREAMLGGWAASPILRLHGQRMLDGNWVPGGRAEFHLKDIATLAALSSASGVATPVFDAAAAYVRALVDAGAGGLDHSAIYAIVREELETTSPSA